MDRTNRVFSQITRRGLLLVVLVGAGMLSHGVARAQSTTSVVEPKAASGAVQSATNSAIFSKGTVAAAEDATPTKGTGEGIKVHGHWTIEIRNPDGKVQTHREFENALVPSGAQVLASVLAGQATVGGWSIYAQGANGPCVFTTGNSGCLMTNVPSLSSVASGCTPVFACFPGLTITPAQYVLSSSAPTTLTLQGTAAASNSGNINVVTTYMGICSPSSVSPNTCMASGPILLPQLAFSSKTLDGVGTDPSPVPVTSGQTIAVTVQFSFQ